VKKNVIILDLSCVSPSLTRFHSFFFLSLSCSSSSSSSSLTVLGGREGPTIGPAGGALELILSFFEDEGSSSKGEDMDELLLDSNSSAVGMKAGPITLFLGGAGLL